MLNKKSKNQILLNLLILLGFLLIAVIYSYPVLEGMVLVQGDIVQHKGMAHELITYRFLTGNEGLWTNSMFSGMPGFFISVHYTANLVWVFLKGLLSPLPVAVNLPFILSIGMFVLLRAFKVNIWLAAVGALAFAYSSNYLISLEAGHNTKVATMGYSTGVLGGIIMAYRGKLKEGLALILIFMAFMFIPSHFQIIYYFLIVSGLIASFFFVEAIREGKTGAFLKTSALIILFGLLALLPNTAKVWSQYEHSKETMRGGASELTYKENKGGLERDYAFRWSLRPEEVLTIYVPYFMGGGSGEALGDNSHVAKALKKFNIPRAQQKQILANVPTYFGEQPFTSGPNYFGAIVIFLFILSFFLVKNPLRYWLWAAIVLSFFMAWGRHFPAFNNLLFDYLPLYNKFRTPSMALHIAGVMIPLLGFMALMNYFRKSGAATALTGMAAAVSPGEKTELLKVVKKSFFIAIGILVLLVVYGLLRDFGPAIDRQRLDGTFWMQQSDLYDALVADRKQLYFMDILRSGIYVTLAASLLWFYLRGRLKSALILLAGLALITVVDVWSVSKRYFNADDFVEARFAEQRVLPTGADMQILQSEFKKWPEAEKNLVELKKKKGRLNREELVKTRFDALLLGSDYRVFNLSTNTFNDAITSYFHKSVGGYHPAKLQRYQDMIDYHLSRRHIPVINMLNTRYIIVPGRSKDPNREAAPVAQQNPQALGNAWFVSQTIEVRGPNDEIRMLDKAYRVEDLSGGNGTHVHNETFRVDTLGSFEELILSTGSDWASNGYRFNMESLQLRPGQSIVIGSSDSADIKVGAGNSGVAPLHARITFVYEFQPGRDAIYSHKQASYFEGLKDFTPEEGDYIKLESYAPNHLIYESNAKGERLAVFSEIYYRNGWHAYIDGEATPHGNVDYILRALRVPAGKHKIEFKFEPRSYYTGSKISLAGSIVLILILLGLLYSLYREVADEPKTKEDA